MKTLILGMGEIGTSLYNILKPHYEIYSKDKGRSLSGEAIGNMDIIHICFPYSDKFINQVKEYQEAFNPKFTVIHSTVPIGTSRKLNAIHSPVVGMHPDLTKSLTTFTKFLGGEDASEVANYFRRVGIKVHLEDKSETTELLKIQSTTFYATMIEFCKEMKEKCLELDVPYDSFLLWNDNYNKGYEKLGYPEYKKPLLQPIMKKQGGHCTLSNLELIDTKFTKFLKEITK